MSLVGTRPPTVDEWELYEPHHRAITSGSCSNSEPESNIERYQGQTP